jgi:hypothetical protein
MTRDWRRWFSLVKKKVPGSLVLGLVQGCAMVAKAMKDSFFEGSSFEGSMWMRLRRWWWDWWMVPINEMSKKTEGLGYPKRESGLPRSQREVATRERGAKKRERMDQGRER